MHVWAIANQKGGVGKTTTVVTLGGLLAEIGYTTLLVDLDPHGSLTSYFGADPERLDATVFALFDQHAQGRALAPDACLKPTQTGNLFLMPASTALATVDRRFGAREGMGLVLTRALETLATRFDYVLLDCPPVLGVLVVNALAAAERLVIPVQTEYLALKGLERMKATLAMVTRSRRRPLPSLIVPTLHDRRTRAALDCLETLKTRYPEELWDGVIPVDTRLREASRLGVPASQSAGETRAVDAYQCLLDELLAREQRERRAAPLPAALRTALGG